MDGRFTGAADLRQRWSDRVRSRGGAGAGGARRGLLRAGWGVIGGGSPANISWPGGKAAEAPLKM